MAQNQDPIRDFFRKGVKIPGKNNSVSVIVIGVIVLLVWLLPSMIYKVDVDEVAVVQLFGKHIRTEERGLQFKLPAPIMTKTHVKTLELRSEEFGTRTLQAGVQSRFAREDRYLNEALMLTGDLNVAIVSWVVLYRISDPVNYLFRVHDVQKTLRDLSEATMRSVIGDRSINEVISDRLTIATQAKDKLQAALENAETGLTISEIEFKNTTVPEEVQPSFNEVNQAVQEREKMIYQARQDSLKKIPTAIGEAEKMISQAEGYGIERINQARGDSSRFVSLYNEYRGSKDVTRRRLYLETIKKVLPKLGANTIIDSDQKGILPHLQLKGGN